MAQNQETPQAHLFFYDVASMAMRHGTSIVTNSRRGVKENYCRKLSKYVNGELINMTPAWDKEKNLSPC